MRVIADKVAAWGESQCLPALGEGEFEQLRRLAHQEFGLDLKSGKEELVTARLRKLVQGGGFSSFHAYYRHVIADTTGKSLAQMIDALVTNHTAFCREPEHFYFLRKTVFPLLAKRDPVEIWSAACSSGEEVWTLACLLNDAFPARRIHVAASDISNRVLRFAQQGLYPADRCEALPSGWLTRYFQVEAEPVRSYRVVPKLRGQAGFERLNLIAPPRDGKKYPVIFCRNVMIYFDRATQEKVVHYLSGRLEPGGFLFVGHAESLGRISHDLEYVQPAVYRKAAR